MQVQRPDRRARPALPYPTLLSNLQFIIMFITPPLLLGNDSTLLSFSSLLFLFLVLHLEYGHTPFRPFFLSFHFLSFLPILISLSSLHVTSDVIQHLNAHLPAHFLPVTAVMAACNLSIWCPNPSSSPVSIMSTTLAPSVTLFLLEGGGYNVVKICNRINRIE